MPSGGVLASPLLVAKLGTALQNDRLKSIWRHAGVVAVDKRRVVALGSDSNAHVFDDPEFGVELAQDRIPILPGRQEGVPSLSSGAYIGLEV